MSIDLTYITEEIDQILSAFAPISLEQMNHVSLMNRIDTKYIVPVNILGDILKEMAEDYKVLDIEGDRIFEYKTEYFDTFQFSMYEDHQNGKLNRFKIRKREYVASGLLFLEIKYKTNKQRTIKKRIPKSNDILSEFESRFIEENSPYKITDLEFKVSNRFNRITLVGKDERLTIDFDISFSNIEAKDANFPEAVIVEFKQSKFNIHSKGIQILKKRQFRPESCSKYCLGAASLNENIKANLLKEKFEFLGKLKSNFN